MAFPSIQFGIENAFNDYYNGGERIIFKNSFIDGTPIKINGLIWMGNKDFMLSQVKNKIENGYSESHETDEHGWRWRSNASWWR